ncbi:MAG: rhodanese-like domain-containing protein [Proteobacteria bacterium]|nr:rhodanese-like domain-containing protein [Desulfocapsa sp.]MBU3946307.1 rhodanese-like domain-containing protein [Pseudomonadota bacterium]MCG2742534.1 rhodanese-like domain-containing protein [Desulfobacteraceae bacterium]MBU3982528.1 rhodanese-like domain-containing protein [Pseudomonadota bacterium]MBU4028194.1 rhodanese-like domain-containing protein [Pseudomonadota bacterium]
MKKRIAILAVLIIGLLNMAALLESFNYVKADDFKQWLDSGKAMVLVDIQVKNEFSLHHFKDSIETNAFPVETEEQRKMLNPAVAGAKKAGTDVVVICPRGGGGAKRCYSYLKAQGIPEEKLFILEGGIAKWPHKEMLVSR